LKYTISTSTYYSFHRWAPSVDLHLYTSDDDFTDSNGVLFLAEVETAVKPHSQFCDYFYSFLFCTSWALIFVGLKKGLFFSL
jgi:hypothetical protein